MHRRASVLEGMPATRDHCSADARGPVPEFNSARRRLRSAPGVVMPTSRCLLPLLFALALGGCAAFRGHPEPATDPQADLKILSSQIDAAAVTACLKKPDR